MFTKFQLNTSQPVNQQIYNELRKAIICCKILPGSLLSEKEISSQFNVSRQPVREAFIKLAEAGLVQILPQRGTFVTKISAKKVLDGQFIREAVECAVIEKAAKIANNDDIQRLELNLLEQKKAVDSHNAALFWEKDEKFHQIIIDIINCSIAWESIENIKAMMDRVRFLSLDGVTPLDELIQQHTTILTAIKEQDSKKARDAQRNHLKGILNSITDIEKQNKNLFL